MAVKRVDVFVVDVAQLVEPRIVIPAVVGSSPIVHPTLFERKEIYRAQRLRRATID